MSDEDVEDVLSAMVFDRGGNERGGCTQSTIQDSVNTVPLVLDAPHRSYTMPNQGTSISNLLPNG